MKICCTKYVISGYKQFSKKIRVVGGYNEIWVKNTTCGDCLLFPAVEGNPQTKINSTIDTAQ